MRKIAILAGIVGAILGSQSDVLAQSYPFVCRGPLTVEFGQNRLPTLKMTFARGRKPATQGVEPGTCAWMDRGVRSTEPDCLQHSPSDVSVQVVQPEPASRPATGAAAEPFRRDVAGAGAVRRDPGAPKAGRRTPATSSPAPPRFRISSLMQAPYLESIATTSAKTHIFQAYRKADYYCFQVERLGP